MTADAYIIDAVRTPIGRIGGALAGVRPDDLAAGALRGLVDRSPDLDPATIDEVYVGDANQAGEDNRNVGRMACLLAGLPTSVPGGTVNRLCGSGLDAIFCASRAGRRWRRRHRRRRWCREHVPRAVGAAEAGEGLPDRARAAVEHDARLADDNPKMPVAVDGRAGRGSRAVGRPALDRS